MYNQSQSGNYRESARTFHVKHRDGAVPIGQKQNRVGRTPIRKGKRLGRKTQNRLCFT